MNETKRECIGRITVNSKVLDLVGLNDKIVDREADRCPILSGRRSEKVNERHILQESVEVYRKAYGHYLKGMIVDTIFRTSYDRRYYKEHGIHLNSLRLGKL